jgi:sugar phosphate isomerase/epimerase
MTIKFSYSTLACPDWTLAQMLSIASSSGYDGVELRFIENEDSLWRLPAFRGDELAKTKREICDRGLSICCVDTSCRFHFPDPKERAQWIEEGERMSDLAAALSAPAIRVFGDKIQAGADRDSTRRWIAESIRELGSRIKSKGVEVWLETHGDFASARETMAILAEAGSEQDGVIWDPANCLLESNEGPQEGATEMGTAIRHVHIKDLRQDQHGWQPVLTGEGTFPLSELRLALEQINYKGFVSFEWEKKWHPEIPDANTALPHFARWFRENWLP